jgi:hypothetical protein
LLLVGTNEYARSHRRQGFDMDDAGRLIERQAGDTEEFRSRRPRCRPALLVWAQTSLRF